MLNHNGGPRHLTDKEFRTLVKTIVLSRLSGHQKLLSISVAAVADEDGQAVLGAEDMKRVCSVQKRDTVFAAKRDIAEDGLGIIATVSQAGRPNKYHVMPPRVVASIIEAYHARIDAGGQPIPKKETSPVPQNGTGDVHEKGTTPIPETGTSPVPQNGTSPEKGDGCTKESFPHTPFKENNKINTLASVGDNNSAREAGQLAILNGAKALMVEQLAAWISPYSPDAATAEKWLVTATTLHGGPVVKEAFSELQAQIASGDVIGRPIVVLNRICERIKKRPPAKPGEANLTREDAKRKIDAIVGRRT
jgi:hypothetical protein